MFVGYYCLLLFVLLLLAVSVMAYHEDLYFSAGKIPAPRIVRLTDWNQEAVAGGRLVLMCEAKAHPRPNITWYHNGAEANIGGRVSLRSYAFDTNRMRSRLEIIQIRPGDWGLWSCMAGNKNGFHLKHIKVNVH